MRDLRLFQLFGRGCVHCNRYILSSGGAVEQYHPPDQYDRGHTSCDPATHAGEPPPGCSGPCCCTMPKLAADVRPSTGVDLHRMLGETVAEQLVHTVAR